MKATSRSFGLIAAGISLFIVVGCSGNGGDNTTQTAEPDNSSIEQPANTAPPGTLSGPLLYQTGYTVVQGTQDNIGFDDPEVPNFMVTTDVSANTIDNGRELFRNLDITYDEKGRAIEIDNSSFSDIPYVISYNNDDSVATISRDFAGSFSKIVFNYEAGRLVSKLSTRERNGTIDEIAGITYTYAANGHLVSAESFCELEGLGERIESSFTFNTDDSGRVIRSNYLNEDGVIDDYYSLEYDINGNIAEVNFFHDPQNDTTPRVILTYLYTASAEPTVNLIGFLAATNDRFTPQFDLC